MNTLLNTSYGIVRKVRAASGYEFTGKPELQTAVNLWVSNNVLALSTYGEINTWNVSQVTDMSYLFYNKATFNDDISAWDVSGVTDMKYMFRNSETFNQSLSWNTSSVTDMGYMFQGATVFNQPLAFDTSSVTNMGNMFQYARAFNQPLAFDTSNVSDMSSMFRGTNAFNSTLTFDTSSVTNMGNMFLSASSFNKPLSFDTSSATNMSNMFFWSGLSTVSYDPILVYLENALQVAFPGGTGYTPSISISFGTARYTNGSAANTARTSLVSNFGWTITDGGGI